MADVKHCFPTVVGPQDSKAVAGTDDSSAANAVIAATEIANFRMIYLP